MIFIKDNIGLKLILVIMLILYGFNLKAQTVGYSCRPLAATGCKMRYSVAKQDTSYYIIASMKSERLSFLKDPIMQIKTFEGHVMKLYGSVIGSGSESGGILIGNFLCSITENNTIVQFQITSKQLELLNSGVAKVRLSTIPIEHERTFSKDKIGKKLYQFYLKQKEKDDDF